MRKVPELRFDGFDEEWEEKKLSKIAKFSKGKGYSKTDLKNSGNPIYLYGEMYTNYKSQINDVETFTDKIKANSVLSKGNEVLIPSSGETAIDLARASHMNIPKVLLGGDLNIIEPINGFDPHFLALELSNGTIKQSLAKKAQGKSVVHLYNTDIKNQKFNYPVIEEQEKIGELFKKIDDLIEIQEGKVSKMEDFKKSMLKKMFPKKDELVPDFRFEGFEGKWKKIATRNLGEVITGNTPSTNNDEYWSLKKKNIWITPTDIKGPTISDSQRYLSNAGFCKSKKIPAESVLITSIASIGKNTINLIPASINQQINAIIPKNYDSYFIMMGFNANLQRFKSMAGKSATQIINKSTFEDFELEVPVLQEQEKIGQFFKNLDAQIENEQKLLELYKKMKKSLLQKMFV